jgi:hypothetical protein
LPGGKFSRGAELLDFIPSIFRYHPSRSLKCATTLTKHVIIIITSVISWGHDPYLVWMKARKLF